MRRSKSLTSNIRVQLKIHHDWNPPVVYEFSPYVASVSSWSKDLTRVDPVRKRAAGPYYCSVNRRNPPSINTSLTYKWRQFVGTSTYVATGFVTGQWYTPVPLKTYLNWNRPYLINQALQQIQDETVNMAVFLRELNQTTALISNSAKKIAKSSDLIRKKRFAAAAKVLGIRTPKDVRAKKSYADNYLAYTFGVLPLLQDVEGAAKHLATRARQLRIIARSRLSTVDNLSLTSKVNLLRSGLQHETNATMVSTYTKFVFEQVVVEYQLANGYWDELQRLGFTNGGVATWESIPYSFVVDTFLNVGQWLGNMDLGLGLELVSASYSQGVRLKGTVKAYGEIIRYPSSTQIKDVRMVNMPASDGDFESYLLDRAVLTQGDLLYTLMFRSPLSVNNAINDTALVVQKLSK